MSEPSPRLVERGGTYASRNDSQGRLRLLDKNAEIYRDIMPRIVDVAPRAVLVVVTDPPIRLLISPERHERTR